MKLLLFCLFAAALSTCPEMTQFRTSYIVESFNPAKLDGKWYELAYIDPAQVGQTCQTLENTFNSEKQAIYQTFKSYIKSVPFEMKLGYEITEQKGFFNRYFLTKLVKFPNVIVDISLDENGGYDSYIEYLCQEAAGIKYEEIRINSRSNLFDQNKFQDAIDLLIFQGIDVSGKKFYLGNYTDCNQHPQIDQFQSYFHFLYLKKLRSNLRYIKRCLEA